MSASHDSHFLTIVIPIVENALDALTCSDLTRAEGAINRLIGADETMWIVDPSRCRISSGCIEILSGMLEAIQ